MRRLPPAMMRPYPIIVRYDAEYVRRSARKPQRAAFVSSEYVNIETIDPDEAECAFRIHSPRGPLLSVLRFRDRLWWPIPKDSEENFSAADFLAGLAAGNPDVLRQWSPPRRSPPTHAPRRVRQWLSIDRDARLAECQSYVANHLLLCGDHALSLGGEPVYIYDSQRGRWDSKVAAVGPDRSAALFRRYMREMPRDFENVQDVLASGDFALADDREARPRAAERVRESIEILQAVRSHRFEVRLDALFTTALKAFERALLYAHGTSRDIDRLRELKAEFVELDRPSGGTALDRGRIGALARLSALAADLPSPYRPPLAEPASMFERFRRSPEYREPLDDADDAAIGRLI